MADESFDTKVWEERLASALQTLQSTQGPFLEKHWRSNGYPIQLSFNGNDETPFPSGDLYDLYETARYEQRNGDAEYYKPLRASLNPVRGVLRSHPTLAHVLGLKIGNDDFHVGILNGSSWACLSHLISGQMARLAERGEKRFDNSVAELNSLLLKSDGKHSSPLEGDLELGFDVVLFHGVEIEDCVELGEGYSLMPFSHLKEFVDSEVLKDIAPDQVQHRELRSVFGIVNKFRWTPEILPLNAESRLPIRRPMLLFQRWSLEFANLLSVSLGKIQVLGKVYEGVHQPLISDSLFNQVQVVLKRHSKPKRKRHYFMYSRSLVCKSCRRHLTGEKQKGRVYYRCHRCPKVSVREDRVLYTSTQSVRLFDLEKTPKLIAFSEFESHTARAKDVRT